MRVSLSASKAFLFALEIFSRALCRFYLRCGCAWCSSSKVIAPATRFHHLARRRFGRRRRSSLSCPRSSGDGDGDGDGCVACRYVGAGFGSVAAYAGSGGGHAPQGHAAGRGWSRTYRFMAARVTAIFVSTLFMAKTSMTGSGFITLLPLLKRFSSGCFSSQIKLDRVSISAVVRCGARVSRAAGRHPREKRKGSIVLSWARGR